MVAAKDARRRVPALDGVRGIALVAVLFFHAGAVLPGGFLGVDLFFTLSGYLITASLMEEMRTTGTIALVAFWKRRARRLLPALFPVMVAVMIYAVWVAEADELGSLRRDAFCTLAYVSNWQGVLANKSYWQIFSSPSPLAHTWSLSIEEQFYVSWPLLVLGLRRFASRRVLLFVTLALVAISAVLMWRLYDPVDDARVYFGTDTRAGAILIGAALAIADPKVRVGESVRSRILFDVLTVIAVCFIGFSWSYFGKNDSRFLYRGGFPLVQGSTAFLLWSVRSRPSSVLARVFSFAPLRHIGTISYGAYLWHWPIFIVVSQLRMPIPLPHAREVLAFTLTLLVATASWRWLEKPILRGNLAPLRVHWSLPAIYVVCGFLLVITTRERPALASSEGYHSHAVFGAPRRVMVVGDSTANVLAWMMRRSRRNVWIDSFAHDGCDMRADNCGGDAWRTHTDTLKPDATVFFVGGAYLYGVHDKTGVFRRPCEPLWDDAFRTQLGARLPDLRRPGTQVWIFSVPYGVGQWGGRTNHREVDCINASIRSAVIPYPEIRILDLAEKICPNGECQIELDGRILRPDGVHFAPNATTLTNWVIDQVAP